MRYITLIAVKLCLIFSISAQDTLGNYEFIETVRSNSYIVEQPIIQNGKYLKISVTKSPYNPQTIEFHPDRLDQLKAMFSERFEELKEQYKDVTDTKVIEIDKLRATSEFTIGKECADIISKEILVYFSITISDNKKIYNYILSLPEFEDFNDPDYKTKPKQIIITEAGVKMFNKALSLFKI